MWIVTLVSFSCVVFFVLLLVARMFGKSNVEPLTNRDRNRDVRNGDSVFGVSDSSYQEVLNLGDVLLGNDEVVLAGCGQRGGEIENVMMATNMRLFFFTRRFGASRYHYDVFDYFRLRPLSLGQAVIGEKLRLLEGDRIAEMPSPGNESWLDSAETTIKIINERIKEARQTAFP